MHKFVERLLGNHLGFVHGIALRSFNVKDLVKYRVEMDQKTGSNLDSAFARMLTDLSK